MSLSYVFDISNVSVAGRTRIRKNGKGRTDGSFREYLWLFTGVFWSEGAVSAAAFLG